MLKCYFGCANQLFALEMFSIILIISPSVVNSSKVTSTQIVVILKTFKPTVYFKHKLHGDMKLKIKPKSVVMCNNLTVDSLLIIYLCNFFSSIDQ